MSRLAVGCGATRYRVLDLVEVAVTRLAGHPLLLEFPFPMLQCVRSCILRIQQDRGAREAAGLMGRVIAILRNRVCKGKVPHASNDGSTGVLPGHVHDLLEQTLEVVARGGGAEFVALGSDVAWVFLRALRAGGSVAERVDLLDEDRVASVYVMAVGCGRALLYCPCTDQRTPTTFVFTLCC